MESNIYDQREHDSLAKAVGSNCRHHPFHEIFVPDCPKHGSWTDERKERELRARHELLKKKRMSRRKPSSRGTSKARSGKKLLVKPHRAPSKRPTRRPSKRPTRRPSKRPTRRPSKRPTRRPSKRPTRRPSKRPKRSRKRPSRRSLEKEVLSMRDTISRLKDRLSNYETVEDPKRFTFATDKELCDWYALLYSKLWNSIRAFVENSAATMALWEDYGSVIDYSDMKRIVVDVVDADPVLQKIKIRQQRILEPWFTVLSACFYVIRTTQDFTTPAELCDGIEHVLSRTFDETAGAYLLDLIELIEDNDSVSARGRSCVRHRR